MRLALDLAAALDPAELVRSALGMEPDPWQADLLRSTADRILVNTARQTGKSTTTAALAVHTAVYEPGALVLLLSPSLRQSGELFKRCLDVYRGLDGAPAADAETLLRLELANGSRILSLPGKEQNLRGFAAVRLLVIDEASRVPDALYTAVRPMLATSGGRLVALSTPWGRRGWWHDAYTGGGDRWQRFEVPATACRRISAAFLEEERAALGPWLFAQEYECRFMDNEAALFSLDTITAALDPEVMPLWR